MADTPAIPFYNARVLKNPDFPLTVEAGPDGAGLKTPR